MGRKGKVELLHPRLREAVDEAVRRGVTIAQILTLLNELAPSVDPDADLPSESAVGRYKQKAEAQMRTYREAQQIAGVWVEKLGQDPGGDVGRLIAQMLRTVAFQALADMGSAEAPAAAPMDIMLLAKAIKDLAGADKISVEREMRVRQAVAAEIKAQTAAAAQEAESIAREGGMSDDEWALIRAKILGVQVSV